VLATHLVVRHTRVAECDLGLVSSCFHRDGDDGLGALGPLGHPRVFDHARALDLEKTPVVGPNPAFMLHGQIEKTFYNWIQDDRDPLRTTVRRDFSR
jgi:hypothetical protein